MRDESKEGKKKTWSVGMHGIGGLGRDMILNSFTFPTVCDILKTQ